jgi:hypothetical protein
MGKRELVIVLAFVVLGVVAYRLTAPPAAPDQEGFSFSRFWNEARRELRGNSAQARFTSTASLPAAAALEEVHLTGINGQVQVFGESRADIAYELNVQSTGPDPDTALGYAKRVTVTPDDLGSALILRVDYPPEARQTTAMTLRVPSRLGVLVANANGFELSDLATARLDNVQGDGRVSRVSGLLSGDHRNGSLEVADVGAVQLSLQRSRSSFDRVTGDLELELRDGECVVNDPTGPVDIDQLRAEIAVRNASQVVRISGTDGEVQLINPQAESKVDVRRAEVDVQLSASVPLTVLTTDDTLRVALVGPPDVTIDAVASQGQILVRDLDLHADATDQESRLAHAFGRADAPRLSLRNSRGDIHLELLENFRAPIVNPTGK